MHVKLNPLSFALLVTWLAAAGSNWAQAAEALALKRVMLSTGGVGYFEHEAVVDGDAELELEVRLDQVDDVLKSIVVYDDQGGVGAVSLPGREPLAQVFRDLPFGPEALTSPVTLLNHLQGAEVRAKGARSVEGRLIRVVPEVIRLPDGAGTVTRHRVSLMTVDGIQHLLFEETDSLQFVDTRLQAQVERALAAIAAHRVRDKRTMRVVLKGTGRRAVRVAYVVGAPLWKTTYRLTLAGDKAGSGLLQGWAVVENMSGHAWRDVELTLLSGNPVTFRQALYTSYYVNRPQVPVEVLGRILPRPDFGVVAGRMARLEKQRKPGKRELEFEERDKALRAPRATMRAEEPLASADVAAPRAPGLARLGQAAVSTEAATQVIFRIPGPISVETGHSLMVPIVDREVPARRVSLYAPDTHATHPLAAVRLTNDSGAGLPPGVLTLYEASGEGGGSAYLGDARLATFPLGEERLVSFALDQKTHVSREARETRSITKAAIERGVMRLTVALKRTTEYRLKAPSEEDRVVLIEVPRRADWKLVSPDETEVELTDSHYRLERRIAKGGEELLKVTLERPLLETVAIASLSLKRMVGYARSTELDEDVRQAFARMADLQREADHHQRRLEEAEIKRRTIFEEQRRIRDNMARVPRDSDLYRRYLDKLDKQETELEHIGAGIEETRALLAKARRALARFIAELKI